VDCRRFGASLMDGWAYAFAGVMALFSIMAVSVDLAYDVIERL
jgi:hypothetical protein